MYSFVVLWSTFTITAISIHLQKLVRSSSIGTKNDENIDKVRTPKACAMKKDKELSLLKRDDLSSLVIEIASTDKKFPSENGCFHKTIQCRPF